MASNTGSKRLDKMNNQDAARRRVATRSGRPRSTPAITIGAPRRRRKARRRNRIGSKFKVGGPATMCWSIISLAISIVALLTQSLLWLTFAALSLAVTALVLRVEARGARTAAPPPPRKIPNPRGGDDAARRRAASGTAPRKRSTKGTSSGGKVAVCSEACQVSGRAKSTCRCKAADCKHGSKAGVTK